MIHPTAIVSDSASIDSSVKIGAYSVIDDNVIIDANTIIESHVVIKNYTKIGKNNHLYQFASIGEDPQDLKYNGEKTKLIIGDNNICLLYTSPSQRDS